MMKISNWAGNITFYPQDKITPQSKVELIDNIKKFSEKRINLKPIGQLHSWSPCTETKGILIDTHKLNQILSVDVMNKRITVEAGIILEDLYEILMRHQLALPTLPNVRNITLGGAISNCTHGTDKNYGTFCSLVVDMVFILATGEEIRIDETHALFDTLLVNLGYFGVLYSITLQCLPAFYQTVSLKRIDSIDPKVVSEMLSQHDSASAMLYPYAKRSLYKIKTVTDKVSKKRQILSQDIGLSLQTLLTENKLTARLYKKILPYLLPKHMELGCCRWDYAETVKMKFKFINMEYFIPNAVLLDVLEALNIFLEKQKKFYKVVQVVLRPVGEDKRGFLSQTYQSGGGVFCDLPLHVDNPHYQNFFQELENTIFLPHQCKISWSRVYFTRDIKKLYPHWENVRKIKKKLDPHNIFSNALYDTLFDNFN